MGHMHGQSSGQELKYRVSQNEATHNKATIKVQHKLDLIWLIDWLIYLFIDWLIDWLVGWLIDWLTDWLIDWLIHIHDL